MQSAMAEPEGELVINIVVAIGHRHGAWSWAVIDINMGHNHR